MIRGTAISHASKIASRLQSFGGIISTPEGRFEAIVIRRAWVFGSAAKGKANPEDLDILVDMRAAGRGRWVNRDEHRGRSAMAGYAKTDKRYLKKYGIYVPVCSFHSGLQSLRRGMKMVRFHDLGVDGNLGDIPETKIMIYPRNDIAALT